MSITPPKTNYLNNKDLLKEIHISKNTYCSYLNPEMDHQYDIILPTVQKINRNTIAEARRNRVERIRKETGEVIDPRKIAHTDLVFRITCWDHIPLAPTKVPKSKNTKPKFADILDFDVEDIEEEILELKKIIEFQKRQQTIHHKEPAKQPIKEPIKEDGENGSVAVYQPGEI